MNFKLLALLLSVSVGVSSVRAEPKYQVEEKRDITFASPDGVDLLLDLTFPKEVEKPPLFVFIHGGGWKNGDRKRNRMAWVASHGYAVASIEYRLSQEAIFPAQIHDCKGAIRWLRANEDEYGYDASRIVVGGTSAGGHLVALLGVSSGVEELEGDTGGNLEQSSAVQGVISYFGPHDFVKRTETQPHKTDEPGGGVYHLLGGPAKERLELAKQASPVTYVGEGDPPMLLLHGDKDKTVLVRQSILMDELYRDSGLDSTLLVVEGGGHGFSRSEEETALILEFLKKHLAKAAE